MSLPTPPLPALGPPRSLLWQKTGAIVSPAPERLQHQQGRGLKQAVVGLTLDSALQHIEEDCVPLPTPWPGLDIGRESHFPGFEAAWVFVFLAAMSSGAGGLLELKAEQGRAGEAGGRRPPRRRQRWWQGMWDIALAPRVHSHPFGRGWGKRWRTSPVTHPQGWKWHSPSCFWLGEDRVPYSDARKMCSDYGSTLVTITNRSVPCQWWWVCPKMSPPRRGVTRQLGFAHKGLEHRGLLGISAHSIACSRHPSRFEQAYVSSLIYGWDGEYFWTALQDINETGAFRWLSGDEVMYTHWNRDQPGKGAAMGGMGPSPPCKAGAGSAARHGPTLRLASSLLP